MGFGTLGFYFGHAMELLGIVLVAIPAALDLRQGGPSRPLVGDLTASELVADQEAFLGPRVRALMLDLAAKDRSTEEHTRRVALLAAAVGEELRLPAATQRHLAIGGLLHDMGKLRVPQAILGKPGPLDDNEFAAIKRHPEHGARLLADLGGFAPRSSRWCSTTTSGSTAPATRAACARRRSGSPRACSPSATSTTHWSPTASTARPATARARSRC